MVTDLGAANHYKLEHLKSKEIWNLVENAELYYVGGYHLTVCVPAILALAEHAAATNKVEFFRYAYSRVLAYQSQLLDLLYESICTISLHIFQGTNGFSCPILGLSHWK